MAISSRWVLEEEFSLQEVEDLVLPEITLKMLKSRMKGIYSPSQLGMFNQAESYYVQNCNYFTFNLEIASKGRLECLCDDFGIFLDLYSGISFLKH
jgi:hypothetical protein